MKIAVTSQNRKTVTGHAGKCRKFWVYEVDGAEVKGRTLLELPQEQSFHESHGADAHPLDDVNVLITGGMGAGLQQRLKQKGILAVVTAETDPDRAVAAWLNGSLAEIAPEEHAHAHEHHHHHHRGPEMKQTLLQEKYPVFVAEIDKNETTHASVDDVVDYLKARIAEQEKAVFIGVFDHYAHTKGIGGEINPDIKAAVDVIFCFGFALPNPQVLAVRPRSIGVADLGERFVVSFMEAPMQPANQAMEAWVEGLRDKG